MKIASWNVNSLKVRLPQLLRWLATESPDVVGLQETKLVDESFPAAEIDAAGYHVVFAGQKAYNGVAVLSRRDTLGEAADVVTDIPGLDDPQRRVMGVTVGDLRFLDLYVPNGAEVGSDKYEYKIDWLEKCSRYIEAQLQQHERFAVVGDFNIAPEDADVHDPAGWTGQVLVSGPERQAFQRLLGLGLTDTFRLFEQEAEIFSWWDYRMGAFRRNRGLRIDHILVSAALRDTCNLSRVDREPRTWDRPSDHAPVLAEFSS
ncbi:MAG: exodeoxyribonuclease III [bacterium]|nr:exodeoxyribonuclease III [bacterium]